MNVQILHSVQPRVLYAATAAIVGLVLLASWLYLFKKPLAEYRALGQTRALLQAKVDSGAELSGEIVLAQSEVEELVRRLQGQSPAMSLSEMVAQTVAGLDRISAHHAVRLLGIKPGSPRQLSFFEEMPFDIQVSGSYFGLYEWLHEVEKALGPMVVKNMEVRPQSGPEDLLMNLKMVTYRSVPEGG